MQRYWRAQGMGSMATRERLLSKEAQQYIGYVRALASLVGLDDGDADLSEVAKALTFEAAPGSFGGHASSATADAGEEMAQTVPSGAATAQGSVSSSSSSSSSSSRSLFALPAFLQQDSSRAPESCDSLTCDSRSESPQDLGCAQHCAPTVRQRRGLLDCSTNSELPPPNASLQLR